MKLIAFGQAAEIIGKHRWEESPVTNLVELRLKLELAYPELKELPYTFSVNQKLAEPNTILQPDDEVAILPPFSGG